MVFISSVLVPATVKRLSQDLVTNLHSIISMVLLVFHLKEDLVHFFVVVMIMDVPIGVGARIVSENSLRATVITVVDITSHVLEHIGLSKVKLLSNVKTTDADHYEIIKDTIAIEVAIKRDPNKKLVFIRYYIVFFIHTVRHR